MSGDRAEWLGQELADRVTCLEMEFCEDVREAMSDLLAALTGPQEGEDA